MGCKLINAMCPRYNSSKIVSRSNVFNLPIKKGVAYVGSIFNYSTMLYDFQSRFYAIRCAFSIFRHLQRDLGCLTITKLYEVFYHVHVNDLVKDADGIARMAGIAPDEPFDYHSDTARLVCKAWAKYETNVALADEDVQLAQKAIL